VTQFSVVVVVGELADGSLRIRKAFPFVQAAYLVAALVKANGERELEEPLRHFSKPELLIIDELGYLPFKPSAAHRVSRRYERDSMLITSTRIVSEWGQEFGDLVVATAILDWLLHHSHVLTIRGDSYCLRSKLRSALVGNHINE